MTVGPGRFGDHTTLSSTPQTYAAIWWRVWRLRRPGPYRLFGLVKLDSRS